MVSKYFELTSLKICVKSLDSKCTHNAFLCLVGTLMRIRSFFVLFFLLCIGLTSVCSTGISVVLKYVGIDSWLISVLSFSKHWL